MQTIVDVLEFLVRLFPKFGFLGEAAAVVLAIFLLIASIARAKRKEKAERAERDAEMAAWQSLASQLNKVEAEMRLLELFWLKEDDREEYEALDAKRHTLIEESLGLRSKYSDIFYYADIHLYLSILSDTGEMLKTWFSDPEKFDRWHGETSFVKVQDAEGRQFRVKRSRLQDIRYIGVDPERERKLKHVESLRSR